MEPLVGLIQRPRHRHRPFLSRHDVIADAGNPLIAPYVELVCPAAGGFLAEL